MVRLCAVENSRCPFITQMSTPFPQLPLPRSSRSLYFGAFNSKSLTAPHSPSVVTVVLLHVSGNSRCLSLCTADSLPATRLNARLSRSPLRHLPRPSPAVTHSAAFPTGLAVPSLSSHHLDR
ncbi:hypothetical protein SprV_0602205400 [Sparganum proliferum]